MTTVKCENHPSEGGHPDDVCGWCGHCLRCKGGDWAQHAHQACREQKLCHLEFQDYNGTVIHRASVAMKFDDVPAMVDIFTFPFRAGISAVRMTQGGRVRLHRRMATARGYRSPRPAVGR